ncbi:MAG: PfkB family carbohydrate kinase [Tissierellales bacterium]|nr:PfkB family carbohydrate kinase [Tissierellales bacterium]
MTKREEEILELLKRDPLISQKDLSECLGITRSSVAVHITNLIKKGYILGKGYVLKEDEYVVVIGGANIDIQGVPYSSLVRNDSNPGEVTMSAGGVGRNIAENITRMGADVKLITALGDDPYGQKLMNDCIEAGIDMSATTIFNDASTSTYLSILDGEKDMDVAIAHMSLFDRMTVDLIKKKHSVIQHAKLIVLDTNIPRETIEYILNTYTHIPIYLDTVSSAKAKKVLDLIGRFHAIKPNRIEAELLTGIKVSDENSLKLIGEKLLAKGVKNVYISLGDEGVYYTDGNESAWLRSPKIDIVNATGAGDAFIAGLVYGHLNNYAINKRTKHAMGASMVALRHKETINPNISLETINNILKEYDLC